MVVSLQSGAAGLAYASFDSSDPAFSTLAGLLVAEAGSAITDPVAGYRITRVKVKDGVLSAPQTLVEGWVDPTPSPCIDDGDCSDGARCHVPLSDPSQGACGGWGSPTDVLVAKSGEVFISDSLRGVVYRLFPTPHKPERWWMELGAQVTAGVVIFVLAVSVWVGCRARSIANAAEEKRATGACKGTSSLSSRDPLLGGRLLPVS